MREVSEGSEKINQTIKQTTDALASSYTVSFVWLSYPISRNYVLRMRPLKMKCFQIEEIITLFTKRTISPPINYELLGGLSVKLVSNAVEAGSILVRGSQFPTLTHHRVVKWGAVYAATYRIWK